MDLVICDLGMTQMDGWEVAGRIREICRERGALKTPFILLTGKADMEDMYQQDRDRMIDSGVDAIIGKPADIPELLEVAAELMKRRRFED